MELVRELRSSLGYGKGDFQTYAIDIASAEFEALMNSRGPYDYIFNLSALKHVRSEKDPFTLMRMVNVNVINSVKLVRSARECNSKNYFCVSTDKSANPVNLMGASKRLMELFLSRESKCQSISMARFANVAFSDGSLLHGFDRRFQQKQPLSAPTDILRYFITPEESGQLCMLAGLLGKDCEIFFPKLNGNLNAIAFSDIAEKFLIARGYSPYICSTEDEARESMDRLESQRKWPCFFFESDTTGEKTLEEFFTSEETLELERFERVGVIKNSLAYNSDALDEFSSGIKRLSTGGGAGRS